MNKRKTGLVIRQMGIGNFNALKCLLNFSNAAAHFVGILSGPD